MTLAEGLNTITVRVTDATSKLGSASITVRLDTTPPAVAIVAPGNGGTVRGTIDLDATARSSGRQRSRTPGEPRWP